MFLSFIFFYFLFFFNDTATTEIYTLSLHDALPISGSTGINTAIFREGWQERLGISYGDLQWSETGERLTKQTLDRKSTRLNSSHSQISYAVFCLKKKKKK